MGKSSQYTHYMQRIDVPNMAVLDIEEEFDGLRYVKAEGLNDVGKAKNVYTEQYADSDRIRYYLPSDDNYANEGTVVTMTFVVLGNGEEREATLAEFVNYVRKGVHIYYDTARNREFTFVVQDEIKVSGERWYGTQPYVELTVPLQNLNGSTREHVNRQTNMP